MFSEAEEIYRENVTDHYEDPYHRGHLASPTHVHEGNNPLCGDLVRIEMEIGGDGTIRQLYFEGEGCVISQASASMMLEQLDGKTVEDIKKFSAEDMLKLYGARLLPTRQKCCLLPWRVIQAAIYSSTDGQETESGRTNGEESSLVQAASPAAEPSEEIHPEKLRADFPILSTVLHGDQPLVYLDSGASSQRPRQVIETIKEVYEHQYANVHRGIHWLSEKSTELYEQARKKLAQFLNAAVPEEVIFTSGTTASINLVARSWGEAHVRARDEILVTEMEHHSNLVPWYQLAERTGAAVRHIPITDDGLLKLDELDNLLSERTKIVALTAVSNVLGTINPLREIIRKAHAAGAVVLVDAAQSVPHMTTDVQALGVDFLAASGHKMLGPSGVGFLYGKRALLDAMPPFLGGGGMISDVHLSGFSPGELPAKFEAGTPPIAQAIALAAAVEYLQSVGLDAICRHTQRLTRRAHEVLGGIGGIRILGPEPKHKGGMVSFTLKAVHAHDVAQVLDMNGIAVRAGHHCTQPLHKRLGIMASVRASFYLYNTLAEVDLLAEGILATKKIFKVN